MIVFVLRAVDGVESGGEWHVGRIGEALGPAKEGHTELGQGAHCTGNVK